MGSSKKTKAELNIEIGAGGHAGGIGFALPTGEASEKETLPFINRDSRGSLNHWDVPATGGYFGGNRLGTCFAMMYLKHLRRHGVRGNGMLQNILMDAFGLTKDDSPETEALRGQMVGFLSTLDDWLISAAKMAGRSLEMVDDSFWEREANKALQFDEKAFLASFSSEDEAFEHLAKQFQSGVDVISGGTTEE
ncbi:MAG: hypothetical protein P1U64_04000 [Alcanivoracaceae bacterium]|nr:hypothetical protein [Alcanivoracaceae bacterium]